MHANSIFTGLAIFAVASHAAQTFPTPDNIYLRWFVGCLQYALANYEKGAAAMKPLA